MSEKIPSGFILSEASAINEAYNRVSQNKCNTTYEDHCKAVEQEREDQIKQKKVKNQTNYQDIQEKNNVSMDRNEVGKTNVKCVEANKQLNQYKNNKGLPALYECSEALLKKVIIINYGDHLYHYNGKCYQEINDTDVLTLYRDKVDRNIGGEKTVNRILQLHKFLLSESRIKVESVPTDLPIAVLENGIFNVSKQEMYKHTPKIITFSSINAKYVENKKCPTFDDFLLDVTGSDEVLIERFWMFLGYVLMQTIEAKVFFVMGLAPDSGKSVLGNFIQSLFPKRCVSNIALNDLNKNFSLAPIVGAAVNVSLDLPSSRLNAEAVSSLKMLTGGDVVTINQKYVPKFSYSNRAKFIFATNNPISLVEEDNAFWNRLIYLPFDYSVPKSKQNRFLQKIFEKEKDAIVSKALKKAKKLLKNNFEFPTTSRIERQMREWKGIENPSIDSFIEECCIVGNECQGEILDNLYSTYIQYCYRRGYEPYSRNIFKIYLENRLNLKHVKMRLGAENPRSAFKGIAIRRKNIE